VDCIEAPTRRSATSDGHGRGDPRSLCALGRRREGTIAGKPGAAGPAPKFTSEAVPKSVAEGG
jgi:hypothetical protein